MSGYAPRTRREWGWHPLRPEWARRVVDSAGVRRGDLVLDLGAGHGALTGPLLAAGARVIAVELHPLRVSVLRERFGDAGLRVVRSGSSASSRWANAVISANSRSRTAPAGSVSEVSSARSKS